jgi:hypothetical protein
MMSHGAAPLICYHARRLDCPAFLRHSKTGQTNRLKIEPIRQRSQHPFPKSPQLHGRYVRSDFRNGRSLRPSSSNLIRSAERDSDGFLKFESLDFFEAPTLVAPPPNRFIILILAQLLRFFRQLDKSAKL